MKYFAYTVWLVITGILVLTILPGLILVILKEEGMDWFEIGDKILK